MKWRRLHRTDESFPAGVDEGLAHRRPRPARLLVDAIVIMTSNLGSDNFKKFEKAARLRHQDRQRFPAIKNEVLKAAEQRFSPEFRNRIDEIVVFSPLTMDEVRQIAQLYLDKTNRQMKRQGKSSRSPSAPSTW
jgi:ATP-dependent Clp protease ATP-binding subunit ClpA